MVSKASNKPTTKTVEDVIEKEGHKVIVVETCDKNGHHNTKVLKKWVMRSRRK